MKTPIEKVIAALNITTLPVVNLPCERLLLELPLNSFTTLLSTRKIKEVFVDTHRIVPSQSPTITPEVIDEVYKDATDTYEIDIIKRVNLEELQPRIDDYNTRVLSVDYSIPLEVSYAILLDGCVVVYTDKPNKELAELFDEYYTTDPGATLSRMIDDHIWKTSEPRLSLVNLGI